jgi:hypothetical protein
VILLKKKKQSQSHFVHICDNLVENSAVALDGPLQIAVAVAFLYLILKGFFVSEEGTIDGCHF